MSKVTATARRLLRAEHGTSMIEMAILAPMLIFLVIGLIEVGRYTYYGVVTAHAAFAGAEYGAQNLYNAQNKSAMQTAALNDAGNPPNFYANAKYICSSNGAAAGACPSGTPGAGTIYYVQVTVTGTVNSLLNYPGIPTSAPVSATSTMRVITQ